jgi:EmrB/QacA subfamily drug resistance transporter
VQDFSWRLIFYVNVPIGIIGFIAAARFLRETHRTAKLRLDVVGLLTGVPAVLALMYAVDRSTSLGWGSSLVVSLLVASVVLMTTFVVRQLRTPEPLLQLSLFRDRTFSWAMVLSFIVVTTMFGTMLLLPLYLQEVHGYDAITTGLLLLPQAAMAAVSMPLGGFLTDRIGPKWVVATGLVLLFVGSVVLAQVHYNSSNWLVVTALLLRGVAMGFAMMPTMAAAMARVPRRYTSRASSITNTLQRVSSSVGIAILVTVLAGQFSSAAAQTGCAPSPAVVAAAAGVLHQPQLTASQYCAELRQKVGASAAQESSGSAQPATGIAVLDAFNHQYAGNVFSDAFDRTFVLIAILSALGIVPAFFLKRPERDASGAGTAAEIAA